MTPYELALRFVGIREIAGARDHPLIRWWASLCFDGNLEVHDEVPWCSSFLNGVAWELRLPRSKSAMARSWLKVGTPIRLEDARPGYDVVVFWRGSPTAATGHVGLFAGLETDQDILCLGGNQGDGVSIQAYPRDRLLGVRRLTPSGILISSGMMHAN